MASTPTPFTNTKAIGSATDLDRFACVFLHTDLKTGQINWDAAAAADYDSTVKPASFKTVTLKAIKKALGSSPPAGGSDGGKGSGVAKGKGGRKRAAAEADADDDGDDAGAKGKAKAKARAKRVQKQTGGFTAVNGEWSRGEGDDKASGNGVKAEEED